MHPPVQADLNSILKTLLPKVNLTTELMLPVLKKKLPKSQMKQELLKISGNLSTSETGNESCSTQVLSCNQGHMGLYYGVVAEHWQAMAKSCNMQFKSSVPICRHTACIRHSVHINMASGTLMDGTPEEHGLRFYLFWLSLHYLISMGECKKDVTPVR